jgi:phosphoglycerol transferase MdoB-like AlkP superfamily enzyme
MNATRGFRSSTKKKFELNAIANVLFILLFSLAITITCFILQPNSLPEILAGINQNYLIFVYNYIPVLLSLIFFFLLTNNIFYSAAIISALFEAASIANRYKILYRDDPLVPQDIPLATEAMSIMSKTNLQINPKMILLVIFSFILLAAVGFFIKSRKCNILLRAAGIVLCFVIAFGANHQIYKSNKIYNALPTSGPKYYVTGNFNSRGFIYSFLHNINTYPMEVPQKYSKAYAEKLRVKYPASAEKSPLHKPHVIIIMSEAFSDFTNNTKLVFDSGKDPLTNFKAISRESLSGHLIVPNFGGGTANTEYDILTGCMTENLSKASASAFRLIRKNTNALPRFFAGNGYNTLFMHPGDAWFYNRSNVYRSFGISDQIFIDAFKKPQDYKGYLVSDEAFANKIIDEFNRHRAADNGNPLFNFNVSIENHMPYTRGKFGSKVIEPVKTTIPLSSKASELLSNYIEGVRDADRALGKLVGFFKQTDEPVILVFYGDHLPNLGQNNLVYNELDYSVNENGSMEEIMNSHKVPFIIWGNTQGKQSINFDAAVKSLALPEDRIIGANYFGPLLYELLGYQGIYPFYDFLNDLRKSVPVQSRYYYKTADGFVTQLPEQLQEKVNDYRIWQYYKMDAEKVK